MASSLESNLAVSVIASITLSVWIMFRVGVLGTTYPASLASWIVSLSVSLLKLFKPYLFWSQWLRSFLVLRRWLGILCGILPICRRFQVLALCLCRLWLCGKLRLIRPIKIGSLFLLRKMGSTLCTIRSCRILY